MAEDYSGYKRVELPNGQIAEFPESMADEEITRQLIKQFPAENNQQVPSMHEALLKAANVNSTPFGNIRDLLYGVGKAGEGIAQTFTGGRAPHMPNIGQENQNPAAVAIGQYLPFAVAGGASLLGSTLGAGAYGGTQFEPGQHGLIDTALNKYLNVPHGTSTGWNRIRNAAEDAVLNMLFHGTLAGAGKVFGNKESALPSVDFRNQATFAPQEGEFGNVKPSVPTFLQQPKEPALSGPIAEDLSTKIMGNRNLEQSGKELASHIKSSYEINKNRHSAEFDEIFNSPTGEISYHTDEPILVKDKLMHDSSYRANNLLEDTKDKNLQLVNNRFMNHATINNAHKLQSELGSEIGYMKRQLENGQLDAEGKNRLQNYVQAQQQIQEDIRGELGNINPKLREEYDITRENWRRNVIPYHSDKQLREIAEGRITNPVAGDVIGIFKNPEENINKVTGDLPQEAKDRIMHIALGKVKEDLKPEELWNARRSLDLNGMSSYVSPEHEQSFRNLRSNLQLEKERENQAEIHKAFVQQLKQAQEQSEKKRLTKAGEREAGRQKAVAESNKVVGDYSKEFNKNYQEVLKEAAEKKKARRDFLTKMGLSSAAVGAVNALGFNQADVIAAALPYFYKGYIKK